MPTRSRRPRACRWRRCGGRRCWPATSAAARPSPLDDGRGGAGRGRARGRCARCSRCSRRPPPTSPRRSAATGPASVEWKLDGARIQVHRRGDDVRVYTRNLNDVTDRAAGSRRRRCARCRSTRSCSTARRSASTTTSDPHAFQDTMSRFGATGRRWRGDAARVLLRRPARRRRTTCSTRRCATRLDVLDALAGRVGAFPSIVTDDADEAEALPRRRARRRARGRDGEGARSPYEAGRRGGRGARSSRCTRSTSSCSRPSGVTAGGSGWLSQPAPRRPRSATAAFVMVGKTFKGLTDELLDVADRAAAGAGRRDRGTPCSSGPSWSSRSRSTAWHRPATRAAWRCASPGQAVPRGQGAADADTIDAVRACCRRTRRRPSHGRSGGMPVTQGRRGTDAGAPDALPGHRIIKRTEAGWKCSPVA